MNAATAHADITGNDASWSIWCFEPDSDDTGRAMQRFRDFMTTQCFLVRRRECADRQIRLQCAVLKIGVRQCHTAQAIGKHSDHIVRLLKERLGKLVLEAPVIGLVLHTTKLQAMAPPIESLFPEPGGTEEDQIRMIELLVARLGEDKVRQVKPVADYRPEVANTWVPIHEKVRGATAAGQLPPNLSSILRPTWLLGRPIPLLVRNHRPFYGSPLRMVSGPERVEAAWWGGTAARDYWVGEGEEHAVYWVYQERVSSTGENPEPRWFLHGLFG